MFILFKSIIENKENNNPNELNTNKQEQLFKEHYVPNHQQEMYQSTQQQGYHKVVYMSEQHEEQVQRVIFGGIRRSTYQPDPTKQQIPFPAPLPKFSEYIELSLTSSTNCIRILPDMNGELIDFYEANNYALEWDAYKNVCSTLLRKYNALNEAVFQMVMLEYRRNLMSETPKRKRCQEPWSYLSYKLRSKNSHIKQKRRRIESESQEKQQQKTQAQELNTAIQQLESEINEIQSTSIIAQEQSNENSHYLPIVDENHIENANVSIEQVDNNVNLVTQEQQYFEANEELNTQNEQYYDVTQNDKISSSQKEDDTDDESESDLDDSIQSNEETSYVNVLAPLNDSRLINEQNQLKQF